MSTADLPRSNFGRDFLETHFPHLAASGSTMLNSGSFGISPITVIEKKIRYLRDFESLNEKYFGKHILPSHAASLQAVAGLLNLQASHCTLIDNVTTGISNLIELFVSSDDAILINTWMYGAIRLAAKFAGVPASKVPRRVVSIGVKLPLTSAEQIVDQVREALDQNTDIRVAIFDHITSSTACVMPVKQLVDLCHQRGILVIIDGAHAIGQIPDLDIADIGADFYVGNLYKWLFAPKSAGIMWARTEELVQKLRPSVVSWFVSAPELSMRYALQGTRDISSLCAVAEAIEFVKVVCGGIPRIHAYCSRLADEASQHLVERWGSHRLPIPSSMEAPCMRVVALPGHLQQPEIVQLTTDLEVKNPKLGFLLNKLDLTIAPLSIGGVMYIRICIPVIVCMEDIRRLGDTIMKLSSQDFFP